MTADRPGGQFEGSIPDISRAAAAVPEYGQASGVNVDRHLGSAATAGSAGRDMMRRAEPEPPERGGTADVAGDSTARSGDAGQLSQTAEDSGAANGASETDAADQAPEIDINDGSESGESADNPQPEPEGQRRLTDGVTPDEADAISAGVLVSHPNKHAAAFLAGSRVSEAERHEPGVEPEESQTGDELAGKISGEPPTGSVITKKDIEGVPLPDDEPAADDKAAPSDKTGSAEVQEPATPAVLGGLLLRPGERGVRPAPPSPAPRRVQRPGRPEQSPRKTTGGSESSDQENLNLVEHHAENVRRIAKWVAGNRHSSDEAFHAAGELRFRPHTVPWDVIRWGRPILEAYRSALASNPKLAEEHGIDKDQVTEILKAIHSISTQESTSGAAYWHSARPPVAGTQGKAKGRQGK